VLEVKGETWRVALDESISPFCEGLGVHECPVNSVPTAVKACHPAMLSAGLEISLAESGVTSDIIGPVERQPLEPTETERRK
jgi:hypothetical protein